MEIRARTPKTSHNAGCVEIITSNPVETVELLNIFALVMASGVDLAKCADIMHTELTKVAKGQLDLTTFRIRRKE